MTVADDGFRILDDRTGKVFEVSARDYVRGALAAEMPPTFHPEALKAQAVAAHTYALRLPEQNRAAPDESLKGRTSPPTRRAGRVSRPKSSFARGTAIWRTPTGRRSAARRTRRVPTCSPGRGSRSWRPTTR